MRRQLSPKWVTPIIKISQKLLDCVLKNIVKQLSCVRKFNYEMDLINYISLINILSNIKFHST